MHQLNNYYFIEVPEGASGFEIVSYGIAFSIPYPCPLVSFKNEYIYLPPGQYSIIGLASEVGEDVAGEIVDEDFEHPLCYLDYESLIAWHVTALSSLASYVRANNLSNCLIVKKEI